MEMDLPEFDVVVTKFCSSKCERCHIALPEAEMKKAVQNGVLILLCLPCLEIQRKKSTTRVITKGICFCILYIDLLI